VERERADRYAGFDDFIEARGAALSRIAYLLTGDHGAAEDLLQSAVARLLPHWRRVRLRGDPEAYLRRIMVNQRTRWWSRRRGEYLTAAPPERATAGDGNDRTLGRVALAEALRALPPRQRAVIVLRFYADLSEAETAAELGCAVGTVKSQTHAALARLRALAPTLDLTMEVTP
jgi:RNA polymerase sigma-70 factor (sigma-E family)